MIFIQMLHFRWNMLKPTHKCYGRQFQAYDKVCRQSLVTKAQCKSWGHRGTEACTTPPPLYILVLNNPREVQKKLSMLLPIFISLSLFYFIISNSNKCLQLLHVNCRVSLGWQSAKDLNIYPTKQFFLFYYLLKYDLYMWVFIWF